MSTTTVKTIGASGADYTVLQTWEDAAPANLTTSIAGGEIWQGQIKAASDSFTSAGTLLTVAGSTVDSTGYKELTTATGASFRDNANVQTNALRANSANGCILSGTANYACCIENQQNYSRFSNLQLVRTTGAAYYPFISNGFTNVDVNNCIIESVSTAGGGSTFYMDGTSAKVRNTLLVCRASSAAKIANIRGGASAYNVTLAVPSDKTAATAGVITNYSGGAQWTNVCVFGATTAISNSGGNPTFTTCYTDQATPPTGFTTVTYDTSTGSGFVNITDATRDYRLKTGSGLLDVGTTDSTNAGTDIAKTSRPQGSAYDIGCWELVPASGGITYPQLERGMRGGFRGMVLGGA